MEIARETARKSDEVSEVLPSDCRKHVQACACLVKSLDALASELAGSAAAASSVDGEAMHGKVRGIRDEAEALARQTATLLLLAEEPLVPQNVDDGLLSLSLSPSLICAPLVSLWSFSDTRARQVHRERGSARGRRRHSAVSEAPSLPGFTVAIDGCVGV